MLDLTLSFNQATYRPNEPVEGTFTLRNAGDQPALVKARLGLNSPYAPAEFRDLTVEVSGPDGRRLDFDARVNIGFPEDQDFKVLQPGESLTGTHALEGFFALDQPGTYQAQATYHNQSEAKRANGLQAWTGEIQAAPVSFTIQP